MSWDVFDYERDMAKALRARLTDVGFPGLPWEVRNAVVESLVLHTRIIVDILLSRGKGVDDILLTSLLPTFDSVTIATLAVEYGSSKDSGAPCWEFNKLMAHPTTHRSTQHDYSPSLNKVWPHIGVLLDEIEAARSALS